MPPPQQQQKCNQNSSRHFNNDHTENHFLQQQSCCDKYCDLCCQGVVKCACFLLILVLAALLGVVACLAIDFPAYIPEIQTSFSSYVRVDHIHTDYFDALDAARELSQEQNQCWYNNPCVHGTCTDLTNGTYDCTCEYGYIGANCDTSARHRRLSSEKINLTSVNTVDERRISRENMFAQNRHALSHSNTHLPPFVSKSKRFSSPVLKGFDYPKTLANIFHYNVGARGRQLQNMLGTSETDPLYIFYVACSDDVKCKDGASHHSNIFNKDSMQDIKDFEQALFNFVDDGAITASLGVPYGNSIDPPAFSDYCFKDDTGVCTIPTSSVNFFFPSVNGASEIDPNTGISSRSITFDGKGPWLSDSSDDGTIAPVCMTAPSTGCGEDAACDTECIEATLSAMASEDLLFFMDRYFSSQNLASISTQSQVSFGVPLEGYSSSSDRNTEQGEKLDMYFERLYWGFLRPSTFAYDNIRIAWYSGYSVNFEILLALFEDSTLAMGSFLFVLVYMTIYIRSLWLSVMALIGIVLSFPIAYVIFRIGMDYDQFNVLNFLSLFLIMGIGADDAFVFVDHWNKIDTINGDDDDGQEGASEVEDVSRNKRKSCCCCCARTSPATIRVARTLKHAWIEAGKAMFITSLTTAASFFANVASSIGVIQEFGIFMGLTVLINFLIIMTLFPLAVTVWERYPCFQCGCLSHHRNMLLARQKTNSQLHLSTVRSADDTHEVHPDVHDKDAWAANKNMNRDYEGDNSDESDFEHPQRNRVNRDSIRHSLSRQSLRLSASAVNILALETAQRHLDEQALNNIDNQGHLLKISNECKPLSLQNVHLTVSAGGGGDTIVNNCNDIDNEEDLAPQISKMGPAQLDTSHLHSVVLSDDEENLLIHMKVGKEFPCLARCFFNCYAPLCRHDRLAIPLVIIWLTIAGLGTWLAVQNVRPADSIPVFFTEDHNLGMVELLRNQYFLENAASESINLQGSTDAVTQYACVVADCSGHGTCIAPTYACDCDEAFKGSGCETAKVAGTLYLTPFGTLKAQVDAATSIADVSVVVSNIGDYNIDFFIDTNALDTSGLCYTTCYDPQYPRDSTTLSHLSAQSSSEFIFTVTLADGQEIGETQSSSISFMWRTSNSSLSFTAEVLTVDVVFGAPYYFSSMEVSCVAVDTGIQTDFTLLPQFETTLFSFAVESIPFSCHNSITLAVTGLDLDTILTGTTLNNISIAPNTGNTEALTFALSLVSGTNTMRIVLLDDVIYTLTMDVLFPSESATLASLQVYTTSSELGTQINEAMPSFNPQIFNYRIMVNALASIVGFVLSTSSVGIGIDAITCQNNFSAAVVEQVEEPLKVCYMEIPVTKSGEVSVSVTAEDGVTTSTYYYIIHREQLLCSGSTDGLTLPTGSLVNCTNAVELGELCEVSSEPYFDCSALQVECSYDNVEQDAGFMMAGSCTHQCTGNISASLDLATLEPGVASVDCSGALQSGQICNITSRNHYDCAGVKVTCGTDGTYDFIGSCVAECTASSVTLEIEGAAQSLPGIDFIDCSSATATGEECQVEFNTTFFDCIGSVACIGGDAGYENTLSCTPYCLHSSSSTTSFVGGTLLCERNWTDGSDCQVNAKPGYACENIIVSCDSDLGDLKASSNCSAICNGSAPTEMPYLSVEYGVDVVVNCEAAIEQMSICSVFETDSIGINCSSFIVQCVNGNYLARGDCVRQCHLGDDDSNGNLPVILGATVDCTSATEPNDECMVEPIQGFNCAGITVECAADGTYNVGEEINDNGGGDDNFSCGRVCDDASFNSVPVIEGANVDCSTAASDGSTCIVSSFTGFNCDNVTVTCVVTENSAVYESQGVCARQCTGPVPTFTGGVGNCSNAEYVDDTCFVSSLPNWNCDNVSVVCDASQVYVTTGLCEVACTGNGSEVDIHGAMSIDCSMALKAGKQCTLQEDGDFLDCSGVTVSCNENGLGYTSNVDSCTPLCSGNYDQSQIVGTESVNCSGALYPTTECEIISEDGYACSGLSVNCAADGSGNYARTGVCISICDGIINQSLVSNANVNCSSATQASHQCVVTAMDGFECSNVSVSCGTNGEGYIFYGSCVADTCSNGVQNQDEEGVDCGGSTCGPCNTEAIVFSINIDFDTTCLSNESCTEDELIASIATAVIEALDLSFGCEVNVGPLIQSTVDQQIYRQQQRRQLDTLLVVEVEIVYDSALACILSSGENGVQNMVEGVCVAPDTAIETAFNNMGVVTNHVLEAAPCGGFYDPVQNNVLGVTTVDCSTAIDHGDECDISFSQSGGWTCDNVRIVCATNSTGNGIYIRINDCVSQCFGTYNGDAVVGASIDCTMAFEGGDMCVVTSTTSSYNCSSVSISCASDGSTLYIPTNADNIHSNMSCMKLCDGASPVLVGSSIDCSGALYPQSACTITAAAGYECDLVTATCTIDGIYLVDGTCDIVCDESVQAFYGGSSDCTGVNSNGSSCVVQATSSYMDCSDVSTTCINGNYETVGECIPQCDGSYFDNNVLVRGASANCSSARHDGDLCIIKSSTLFDCTGVTVSCDAATGSSSYVVSSESCAAFCDPILSENYDAFAMLLVYDWGTANCSQALLSSVENNICNVSVADTHTCGTDGQSVLCTESGTYAEQSECSRKCSGLFDDNDILMHMNVNCSSATTHGSSCEMVEKQYHQCDEDISISCSDGVYILKAGSCVEICQIDNRVPKVDGTQIDCSGATMVGDKCVVQPVFDDNGANHVNCSTVTVQCVGNNEGTYIATGQCVPLSSVWTLSADALLQECTISPADSTCISVNSEDLDPASSQATCVVESQKTGLVFFENRSGLFVNIDSVFGAEMLSSEAVDGDSNMTSLFIRSGDSLLITWDAMQGGNVTFCLDDTFVCDSDAIAVAEASLPKASLDCTSDIAAQFPGGQCAISAKLSLTDCTDVSVTCMSATGLFDIVGECSAQCNGDGDSILTSSFSDTLEWINCENATSTGEECVFETKDRWQCSGLVVECGIDGEYVIENDNDEEIEVLISALQIQASCQKDCEGEYNGCTASWCETLADLPGVTLPGIGPNVILEPAASVLCDNAIAPGTQCNIVPRDWYSCNTTVTSCSDPTNSVDVVEAGVYMITNESSCVLTGCSPAVAKNTLMSLAVLGGYQLSPTFNQGSSETNYYLTQSIPATTSSVVLQVAAVEDFASLCGVSINGTEWSDELASYNGDGTWTEDLFVAEGETVTVLIQVGSVASTLDANVNVSGYEYWLSLHRLVASNNANLSSLGLPSDVLTSSNPLVPDFSPSILSYTITVANEIGSITMAPIPQNDLASVLVNGEFTSSVSSSTIALRSTHGLGYDMATNITITVIAESQQQQTYTLSVFRPGFDCEEVASCSGHGECDINYGSCICDADWYGEACSVQCIDGCGAHGMCDVQAQTTQGCICDEGYYGIDCSERVCPGFGTVNGNCSGHGLCNTHDFSCECESSAQGELCEQLICPNTNSTTGVGCGGNGVCLENGTCTCNFGFTGVGCDTFVEEEYLIPWSETASLTLLWGIGDYSQSSTSSGTGVDAGLSEDDILDSSTVSDTFPYGTPIFDSSFDPSTEEAQVFLLDVCDWLVQNSSVLKLREASSSYSSGYCFFTYFYTEAIYQLGKFPVPQDQFNFIVQETLMRNSYFEYDVGLSDGWPDNCDGGKCSITYLVIQERLNLNKLAPALESEPVYEAWNDFVSQLNTYAPSEVSRATHVCDAWNVMIVEIEAVSGAITAVAISVSAALIAVMIFTGNLLLSAYVGLSIVIIVVCLACTITWILQWPFGLIESICLTIFVGFSVDYVLHMAHIYNDSIWLNPFLKTRHALAHIAPSILSAAITTIGSSIFLVFCQIYIFVQMGWLLLLNTLLAILCALTFFSALVSLMGPWGRFCDCYAKCRFQGKHLQEEQGEEEKEKAACDVEAHGSEVAHSSKQHVDAGEDCRRYMSEREVELVEMPHHHIHNGNYQDFPASPIIQSQIPPVIGKKENARIDSSDSDSANSSDEQGMSEPLENFGGGVASPVNMRELQMNAHLEEDVSPEYREMLLEAVKTEGSQYLAIRNILVSKLGRGLTPAEKATLHNILFKVHGHNQT